MFEPKTFDQIFGEMRDRTPPQISDFQEGSIARTLYETFAFEVALLYEQMHQVYLSAFVDTATGSQLDLVVAILGIKRGEPDFAMGVVTFERDLGIDQPIQIPAGFLLTTREDAAKTAKKTYQTVESQTLSETESQVQVRVQAIQPGDTEVAEANTVQVMPQPLPGIKAITNEQPIRFTGKRRETDEELRDRAKVALLAASGANTSTIETTLFSLPGIKEVWVREPFHYARGTVLLRIPADGQSGNITIPRKTTLLCRDQPYLTQETVVVQPGSDQMVRVEAMVKGPSGEVLAASSDWQPLEHLLPPAGQVQVTVQNPEPISLKDFGVIEVFVDGVDWHNGNEVRRLEQEIDRVRAAGIYVFLKPTWPVYVDGSFLVELKPGHRFSREERRMLEVQLQEALVAQMHSQRLGQPLLLAQLTQTLLADRGVSDLVDFELTVHSPRSQEPDPIYDSQVYTGGTKRLEVEMMEKFVPRHIRVASEIKPLPIHIQMQVPGLDDRRAREIRASLQAYFRSLSDRQPVLKQDIHAQVCTDLSFTLEEQQQLLQQTQLIPEFWHSQVSFDGSEVPVSLLERAELGEVLLYKNKLEITGALQLVVPLFSTDEQQQGMQTQVREHLQAYLERLKPEESIDLKKIGDLARSVHPVLDAVWKAEDFSVRHAGETIPLPDRIKGFTIEVAKFEKPILAASDQFIIATTITPVTVTLTQVQWRVKITGPLPARVDPTRLEAALRCALGFSVNNLSTQLPQPRVGQSVDYKQIKEKVLPQLLQRATVALSAATIRMLFSADPLNNLEEATAKELAELTNTLLQTAEYSLPALLLNGEARNVSIRIVEQASLVNLAPDQVSIVLEMPSQGSSSRGSTMGGGPS